MCGIFGSREEIGIIVSPLPRWLYVWDMRLRWEGYLKIGCGVGVVARVFKKCLSSSLRCVMVMHRSNLVKE